MSDDKDKLYEKFQHLWGVEIGRLDESAYFSLKTLFVLNGGALLALFAFISALLDSKNLIEKTEILRPFLDKAEMLAGTWLLGLIFALLANLLMYFTFRFNLNILQKYFKDSGLDIPGAPKSECYRCAHSLFTVIAIISGVLSSFCVIFGLYELSGSIETFKLLLG